MSDSYELQEENPKAVLTEIRHEEPLRSPASARNFAVNYTDGLMALVVLLVSLATAAWFTRNFYFFQDDFIFVRQAQETSLSLSYLREPLFEHFSPVARFGDFVLAHWFNSSIAAAHAIALLLFAASVLAFSWAITEITGRRWWRHILTLAFGQSLALIHLLGWWTATINILPATLLGLITIAAFLRYRRLGKRGWVVVSLLSYAVSLCTHESSWLVPLYLALFDLFVLAPDRRSGQGLVRLWREGWIWLTYGVLTGLAVINFFAFYYAPQRPRATVGELFQYVGVQFTQGFTPTAIGLRPLTTGWTNTTALTIDGVCVAAIVILSVVRSTSAWRIWMVFGIGFLANALMVGVNRVGFYGVDFGKELYYLQAPAYLFLLCIGAAFSIDPSGAPYALHQDGWAGPQALTHLSSPNKRWIRIAQVTACLLAVGLYEVAFAASASAQNGKDVHSFESELSRAYFTKLFAQISSISSSSRHGTHVSLLDAPVPGLVASPNFAPFDELSSTFAMLKPDVAFNQLAPATFEVGLDGTLVPQRFESRSGSLRGLPIAAAVAGPGATPTRGTSRPFPSRSNATDLRCFVIARPGGRIDVQLRAPLFTADAWLLVGTTGSSQGAVAVSSMIRRVRTPVGTIYLDGGTSENEAHLLPLSKRGLDAVELTARTAGQNLCVSSIDVGMFFPSG